MATTTVTITLTTDTANVVDIQAALAVPGDTRTTVQIIKDEIIRNLESKTLVYRLQKAQENLTITKPIIT